MLLFSDLFRRVCDKSEKDFLREKGVVSETQSDLGKKLFPLVKHGFSNPYQMSKSIYIFRGIRSNFYAPNFEKVGSILLSACPSFCSSVCSKKNLKLGF